MEKGVVLETHYLTFLPLCTLSASFCEEKRKKNRDKRISVFLRQALDMSQRSTAQHCHTDTPFCTIRNSHVTWNFAVPVPHGEEIRRCILLFLCTLDTMEKIHKMWSFVLGLTPRQRQWLTDLHQLLEEMRGVLEVIVKPGIRMTDQIQQDQGILVTTHTKKISCLTCACIWRQ